LVRMHKQDLCMIDLWITKSAMEGIRIAGLRAGPDSRDWSGRIVGHGAGSGLCGDTWGRRETGVVRWKNTAPSFSTFPICQ